MGVHVPHVLPMIGTNDVSLIDRKALIGVDGNQDDSFEPNNSKVLVKIVGIQTQAAPILTIIFWYHYQLISINAVLELSYYG